MDMINSIHSRQRKQSKTSRATSAAAQSLYLHLSEPELGLQLVHLLHPCSDLVPQRGTICNIVAHGSQNAEVQPTAQPTNRQGSDEGSQREHPVQQL